ERFFLWNRRTQGASSPCQGRGRKPFRPSAFPGIDGNSIQSFIRRCHHCRRSADGFWVRVIELMRRGKFVWLSLVLALSTAPVCAASENRAAVVNTWSWPPVIVAALALMAVLYTIGTVRMLRRSARPR